MGADIDPRWEAILGLAGTLAAVALFIAPVKTFQRILTKRSTEEFSPFPYVSTFLNCAVWTFYCLPSITPNRTSPLITNVIGLLFQSTYLIIFSLNAHDNAKTSLQKQLAGLAAFFILFLGLVLGVLRPSHRSSFVGFVATIFTVIMFGAPLSSVAVVLRTRSVEYMPLPLLVMGFVCSSTWTVYGIYVQDAFVIVPNVLGMILGLVQLGIYHMVSSEATAKGAYGAVVKGNGNHGEDGVALTEMGTVVSEKSDL